MKRYTQFYMLVLLIVVFLVMLSWLLVSFIRWEFLIPNITVSWFDFRVGVLVYTFFFSCAYKIATNEQDENI
jgi:uncharacterized BrkB/YihY/UPF0761 family membrane protein